MTGIPETWTLEDFAREMEKRAEERSASRERWRRRGLKLDALGFLCVASSFCASRMAGVPMGEPIYLAGAFVIGLNVGAAAIAYYARKSERLVEDIARLEREVLVMAAREGR